MHSSTRARRILVAAAVAGAVLVGTVPTAGAAAPDKHQVIVSDDFSSGSIEFVVEGIPEVMAAGTYKVGLANNSIGPHVLVTIGGLPEGLTVDEFIEIIEAVEAGEPPPEGAFEAGAVFSKPGQDHQKLYDLTTPGQYGYFCPIRNPVGTPHYQMGFVGVFDVEAG
jgi:plastocyanin